MRLSIRCQNNISAGQQLLSWFSTSSVQLDAIEFHERNIVELSITPTDDIQFDELKEEILTLDSVENIVVSEKENNQYIARHSEALQLNEAMLANSFPEPLFCIDSFGAITFINEAAAKEFSEDEATFLGKHIQQYFKALDLSLPEEFQFFKVGSLNYQIYLQPILSKGCNQQSDGFLVCFKTERLLKTAINRMKDIALGSFSTIETSSLAMKKVLREAKRMASLDSSILIMGETGTGKEIVARACHYASQRADNAFMTLNCGALPDEAAEYELFGIGENSKEPSKIGLFELADGGTIFLDEIGEMSEKLQGKLLRVIQNGSFRRVNSDKEITVDVRIISSTNKDLLSLVSEGKFRDDLYYRLNVFGLTLPALRKRVDDITPLTMFFIDKTSRDIDKENVTISDSCRDFLVSYPWPGNVRQLENVVERAVSLLEGDILETEHLQLPAYSKKQGYLDADFEGTLDDAVKNFESNLLKKLYPAYPSSRQLAKKLGLSHTAIANKLREYDINKKTIKG